MLPCNSTSKNYILIIVFKYNNYDRGMLSDLSVQMETPNLKHKCSAKKAAIPNFFPTIFITK